MRISSSIHKQRSSPFLIFYCLSFYSFYSRIVLLFYSFYCFPILLFTFLPFYSFTFKSTFTASPTVGTPLTTIERLPFTSLRLQRRALAAMKSSALPKVALR